jgi:hypothetical protein
MKQHCSRPSAFYSPVPLRRLLPPFTVELCLTLQKLPLRTPKNQPPLAGFLYLGLDFIGRAALFFPRPELPTQPAPFS